MSLRRAVLTLCAMAGLAAGAFAQTTTSTNTRTFSFPVVGVAGSETVQVDLVNLAGATSSGTAASCTGTVAFYNASGTTYASASSFTLASNAIGSAKLAAPASSRSLVRAVVTLTETSGVPCDLQSTLETYDTSTGVTHAVVTGGGMGGGPGFGH